MDIIQWLRDHADQARQNADDYVKQDIDKPAPAPIATGPSIPVDEQMRAWANKLNDSIFKPAQAGSGTGGMSSGSPSWADFKQADEAAVPGVMATNAEKGFVAPQGAAPDRSTVAGQGGLPSGANPFQKTFDAQKPDPKDMAALAGAAQATPKDYGYGADLDDAALAAAQGQARKDRALAGLTGAGRLFAQAFAGKNVGQDDTFEKQELAAADKGVTDIKERRTAKDAEMDRKTKLIEQGTKAQRADPNSAVSKASVSALQDMAKAAGMNLTGFENMSADQIDKLLPIVSARLSHKESSDARRDAARENALNRAALLKSKKDEKDEKEAKVSDKQVDAINQFDTTTAEANNLMGMLGNHSEWTGAMDGRVPDMFVGPDQMAFRSSVGRLNDAYRKLITGAGAGMAEIARLESRLPQPTDTFENFKSKAMELAKETQAAKSRYLHNLNRKGKNVNDYVTAPNENFKMSAADEAAASPKYDADVVAYAQKHGISNDMAQQIKTSRTGN
jgi:hypothetical protein